MQDQMANKKEKSSNEEMAHFATVENSEDKSNLEKDAENSADLASSHDYFEEKLKEFEQNKCRF